MIPPRSTRRSLLSRLALSGAVIAAFLAAQRTANAATSVFDGANRLVSTTEGSTTVIYAYDGLGNLAKRCVNGACTDLVLDDSSALAQVVGESPVGPATSATYAYGPAGVAAQRGAGSLYPVTDSLGSVRGLVDAAGSIAGRHATDAFGATRSRTGAPSSLGYTGELSGAEDGKIWLRARSHDPRVGRFDQRDTFEGFAERGASLNRYSYAENNAANLTDPSGHFVPAIAWGGLLATTAIGFLAEMIFPSPVGMSQIAASQDECDNLRDYERAKSLWDVGMILVGGLKFSSSLPGKVGNALRAPVSLFRPRTVPKPPVYGPPSPIKVRIVSDPRLNGGSKYDPDGGALVGKTADGKPYIDFDPKLGQVPPGQYPGQPAVLAGHGSPKSPRIVDTRGNAIDPAFAGRALSPFGKPNFDRFYCAVCFAGSSGVLEKAAATAGTTGIGFTGKAYYGNGSSFTGDGSLTVVSP